MSETPESLSPRDIASEASALAAHLQRQGLQFLPAAKDENVTRLQQQFAQPEAAEPAATPAAQEVVPAKATNTVPAKPPAQPTRPTRTVSAAIAESGPYPEPALPPDQRASQLEVINQEVAACLRCEVLAQCRTNTVFGEGSATPRIVFFGEGPGADEDKSGRPFVGKAGQLLTKMIEACTLKREDVYIMNTVKCRPPGNRNPEPDELSNCREFYQRQLTILQPEYIVCLGAISAQELLKSKLSVGRLRGTFHRYFESKVVVTYHPAYLLRNPSAKKAAWQDLQLMLRDAGIQL